MTEEQGYQNPAAPVAITSSDPETPLELDIRRGTPAVDMRNEIFGRVWGVTSAFCVMRAGTKAFVNVSWRHVALGHVQPARVTLPRDVHELDRLDYYATTLRELDALYQSGLLKPLPRPLRQARRHLMQCLKQSEQATDRPA